MASALTASPSATGFEGVRSENSEAGPKCLQVFRNDGKHIDVIEDMKGFLRLCRQEGAEEECIYTENGRLVIQYANEDSVRFLLSRSHHQLNSMGFHVQAFSPKLVFHTQPDDNSIQVIGLDASMSDKGIFKFLRKWTKFKEKPKLRRVDVNTVIATFQKKLKDFTTMKKEVERKTACIVSKVFARDCILVRDLDSGIEKIDLDLYFNRPLIGGGDIRHVYVDKEQMLAVIQFEDPAVVDTVLRHKHKLKGSKLAVMPYGCFFMKEAPQGSCGKDVEPTTQGSDEEIEQHSGDSPQTDSSDDEKPAKGTAPRKNIWERHFRIVQKEKHDLQKKYMETERQLDEMHKLKTEQETEIRQLKSKLADLETDSEDEQRDAQEEYEEKPGDQYQVESTLRKNRELEGKLNECLSVINAKDSELTELRERRDQSRRDITNLIERINVLESNEQRWKELNEYLSKENCKIKTEKANLEVDITAMEERLHELGASRSVNDAETRDHLVVETSVVDEKNNRGPICQEVRDNMINKDDVIEMTAISGKTNGSARKARYKDNVVVVKKCGAPLSAFHCFERMILLPEEYCVRAKGIVQESKEPEVYSLVMDFMKNGSLRQLIKTNFTRLTWTDRVQLSLSVCRCVLLLHGDSFPVVLGKIGSHKFLVGPNREIKMFDLELTREPDLAKQYLYKENRVYMPPEHVNSSTVRYTLETEAYGLGLILKEIATGKPADGVESLTEDCPDVYRNVVNKLTQLDPSNRITVQESICQLEQLLTELSARGGKVAQI